jgi:hypothetical protein
MLECVLCLTFLIGLYCTVFSPNVCYKVALYYFIAHFSTLLHTYLLYCTLIYFIAHFFLGLAWIPSCKSALILAILPATVASVPDITFPAQSPAGQ